MGLASVKAVWQRQTLHFGHQRGDKYSVLLIDNRGIGESDKPLMRYSTSEMAKDVIEVLAHVGWVSPLPSPTTTTAPSIQQTRQVHVAGISMGGMIAQEVAMLIPSALSSLTLVSTAAALENTTTFAENAASRISMLMPKGVEASVRSTALRVFARPWLVGPDDVELPDPAAGIPGVGPPRVPPPPPAGKKGDQQQQQPQTYGRFGSRYQRWAAEEMHKRRDPRLYSNKGVMLQMVAAGWHRKSPEQLAWLADRVGRERIAVVHGSADEMMTPPHGRKLIEYLRPAVGEMLEGVGHGPVAERCEWFNGMLAERMAVGEKLDGRA